jgi:uncharacterized protein with ParB-like and HNH nuclease domain
MEATPTQIINYFSGFKQNLVPLFQRPYTWSEKQWRTLWEDLLSFYDTLDLRSTHFMGAVVTMPARSVPVGVSKFLIIDGQQRLTTVAILMCAVRDALTDETLRRRIQSFYLTNEGFEGTDFFKLLPTQGDRDSYAPVITSAGSVPESQFKKAYDFFKKRLRDTNGEGIPIDPRRILETVETRLMVVMINLSDTDDPYLIFESLNFKGSPLEQADLVRNFFLMRFSVNEQPTVYKDLWLPMQNRLGPALTDFMRHFLGAEGEEVRKGDVYAAIKRLVADSDSASVRVLMTRMERLSLLYSRIAALVPDGNEDVAMYFDDFRRLDFGSVYPLLLALYEDLEDGQFEVSAFLECLRVLHSFIIRRMVVGVPSNSLSGLFILLCKNKPVTEDPGGWLSSNLAREDKNRRWPTDTEFAERWPTTQIYGSRACQVILECLERQHEHHELASFAEASIEHVMPQSLTPEWHEALGPEAIVIHRDWLHTIGNLTLSGYNPELSNRSYSEKRGLFALSHFELNRDFARYETWGRNEIRERANLLYVMAVGIWPRPPIDPKPATPDSRSGPSAFHSECIRAAEKRLSEYLLKLSQTRYVCSKSQDRLICAVSAEHNEAGGTPYFWFAIHKTQIEFLSESNRAWICLGCGSGLGTLLIPLSVICDQLDAMSVTRTEDRYYWHVVVQRRGNRYILRLLGGTDGPDLTDYRVNVNESTAALA